MFISATTAQLAARFTRLVRRRPLLGFFLLAYFFGWIAFLPLVLTNIGLGVIRIDVPIEFIEVGAFTPTIAALCVQWLLDRNFRIFHLYSTWKRLVIGAIVGLALCMIAFVVAPSLALVKGSLRELHWAALLTPSVYVVNLSTFFGGPVNEEPGWRGFALPRLQERFGPLAGSIFLGLLWTGWHLPLFLLHGWVNVPVWAYTLLLVAASVLITLGNNISGFSIIVPIMMHAILNTSTRLLAALSEGLPTRTPELLYYLGAIGATAIAAILFTAGRLGFPRVSPQRFPAMQCKEHA